MDLEAARLIKELPKWTSCKINQQPSKGLCDSANKIHVGINRQEILYKKSFWLCGAVNCGAFLSRLLCHMHKDSNDNKISLILKNNHMGFVPISIDQYVKMHLKSNPTENGKDLRKRLNAALADYRRGIKCSCGNDIWVIGSASVGNNCFTCITGESSPTGDYEIFSHKER